MKNFKVWAGALLLAALVAGVTSCSKDETTGVNSSSSSLKSTDDFDADSIMFIRDPSGTGIGAFRMYGIKLTNDTYPGLTSSISTDDASLDYQLYFYNEKVFAYDTTSSGTGCPALFLGAGVTGYNTGLTGYSAFGSVNSSSIDFYELDSESAATLPISTSSSYRFSNGKLSSSAKTLYYPTFIIGNTFQGLASASQPIYILQIGSYYYAFMVSRFQNGTSQTNVAGTDKRYMTIKYKRIL